MDLDTWKKAWALLDARERRNAWITLAVVILGALSSALMVGSVLPFLSVLSDPGRIERVSALNWAYKTFGFDGDYAFLVALGGASFAVIVMTSLIQIGKTYVVARFAMMRVHSISHRLLIAYLRQPYPFFLNRHTGEMSTRVLAESEQLVVQFLRPAAELIASMLTVIAIVSLLMWVDPIIAVIAFGVLGGVYGAVYVFSRRILKGYGRARAAANSERFRIANEALGGIKDIKLLGREWSYAARYANPSQRMARAIVGVQVLSQVPQFALQAVAFGGVILLCIVLMDAEGLASGAALGGILPILGVFAFAGQRLMPELGKLYQSLAQLQAGSAAVEVVHDDLMGKAGSGSLPQLIPAALGFKKRLEFRRISYRYPNAELAGLKDVSFDIRAGERIGVVGSTGAGKTTLADLVLGLLTPEEGRILVDGTEITPDNLRAWQQTVGYVPQDIFLTDGSISENIALGVPPQEIDDARVRRASEIARIDAFIREELPDGYATTIGERGVRLSGGQRQRIGIARALYHDAELIVFDEATSALDNLTEFEVMAAIDALPGDKTVLMIAHRLSTLKHCDQIIVLDKGWLVGCDTWEALMENNPAFQKIATVTDAA
ncbi:ABC transporter ATP-binding protein/permease [Martelella mediterranea]|uniref:ABC transporter ATP-binding protein n=1 Tax=Martelella mediterranea TaxID=293089 RepID=UPI001E2BB18B|nr:ABC transporter ATP-binding protein [Martelella mediterranea]MCD1636352.1 ABC transporter ATP-binding protein/permease [Martelella mediterranea]